MASPMMMPLPPQRSKFYPYSLTELEALPTPSWLIQDVLPEESFSVLFGAPGEGKTFVAVDLALSIATGTPWQGTAVERGTVVYMAGEAVSGLRRRVKAWEDANSLTAGDFFVVREAVQFTKSSDVDGFLQDLRNCGVEPVLVVVDTLARSFVGADENSSTDVGELVDAARRVQQVLGCAILFVHHSNKRVSKKNGPIERGSGALRGAADVMMQVSKSGATVTLACDKQKEAAEFDAVELRMEVVSLGSDKHGPPVSSCVLRRLGHQPSARQALNSAQRMVLDVLAGFGDRLVTTKEWLDRLTALPGAPCERTFYTHAGLLVSRGDVQHVGKGCYALTASGAASARTAYPPASSEASFPAASATTLEEGGAQQETVEGSAM